MLNFLSLYSYQDSSISDISPLYYIQILLLVVKLPTMSSPSSPPQQHPECKTAGTKRKRIVQGSCWPCKQRRVKCDLRKPSCEKCHSLGAECCYDRLLLRWSTKATKGGGRGPLLQTPFNRRFGSSSGDEWAALATNDQKALDYFRVRLWPLLYITGTPFEPPVSIALYSRPVLLAACIFAEAHRALHGKGQSDKSLISRRHDCLTTIRAHLSSEPQQSSTLRGLLVAVLLMYFSDGYVDCGRQHASTSSHHQGTVAIIQSLGGYDTVWATSGNETKMLLSEFATSDLTSAVIRGRAPSFPSTIWHTMSSEYAWWKSSGHGTVSLPSTFAILADISICVQNPTNENHNLQDMIRGLEHALRPSFPVVEDLEHAPDSEDNDAQQQAIASQSLYRAFQHAGLIYLYVAFCGLPACHHLVQQHVQACLDCIRGIDAHHKVHNCALFPLYIAGAYSLRDTERDFVEQRLESMYAIIRFQSVRQVQLALRQNWSGGILQTWEEAFVHLSAETIVL
jgi:hypothetical protein